MAEKRQLGALNRFLGGIWHSESPSFRKIKIWRGNYTDFLPLAHHGLSSGLGSCSSFFKNVISTRSLTQQGF
jgi:hypothetical protein